MNHEPRTLFDFLQRIPLGEKKCCQQPSLSLRIAFGTIDADQCVRYCGYGFLSVMIGDNGICAPRSPWELALCWR